MLTALRGEVVLASEGLAPGGGPAWPGCPYLGLVPFGEREAPVFYGRGELAGQLVRRLDGRLDGPGILLVAGESGAGKSSLLQAGLMPLLAAGALGPGSEQWPRRVIQPAGSPLRELAMHLAELAGTDPVSVYRSLSAAPGEAPMLAELAVRTAAGRGAGTGPGAPADAAAPAPPRLVLVVDQFEELFTAGEGADAGQADREAFIAALHAAATVPVGSCKVPQALVVAAVRADFLGRLIAGRGPAGVHAAHRDHPGWTGRAAAVRPGRPALPGAGDGGRRRCGRRGLQCPPPAGPRPGQRGDRP